ncbi:E3 SUMO-protein ligase KIAA1586-like [Amphiprion ocellaris]|uniref:E3 SUMO-protein ligase KIAA1586-like n=1 Tax=Amphiprion ocellaris TaxID=80972 RepID=UPI00241199C9|nr:E3 SUMO-protein ligase KIAA1586-like [Amphiprion ocellaris]
MNINATSQEFAFETTARVFRTAYYVAKSNKPFTDFESLIDLQEANSMNLGRVLHSVDIVDHVASQMKNEILKKIIKNKSKITILADESTTVGNKSTLIVFLKASVDGAMEPIAFPLELVELDSLNAAHIKVKLLTCLQKNGLSSQLLQQQLIGFCSDGASVMLGVKSGVGKLLKDDFPSIVLWHCPNHRLELADQALDKKGGTKDFHAFLDSLYALYSQSPKNTRELSECAHNLHITLRRIGKVFTVRWVASSWRAVSAVWQSYPALAQHFRKASEDHSSDSKERAKFSGLLSKLCSVSFVKSLALMVDILTELKNLSEILQSRKTTIPKAHEMMTIYVQRIESLCDYPGKHTVEAVQSEQKMIFEGEQLRVGKSPTIDSVQFIHAVVENMKQRLFTTTANRAQSSVVTSRKEAYNSLINQMAVLNPDSWVQDNPHYGEEEVKGLCDVLSINDKEAHIGFIEYKASGGRSIPDKLKKLFTAVNTLSASNADCERGFSTMNNILTEYRGRLTTVNASNLLLISSVGPPCKKWDPLPYVKTWLGKGRRAAHATSGMARHCMP